MIGNRVKSWTYTCGGCLSRQTIYEPACPNLDGDTADKMAREAGWSASRRAGWRCPACRAEEKGKG